MERTAHINKSRANIPYHLHRPSPNYRHYRSRTRHLRGPRRGPLLLAGGLPRGVRALPGRRRSDGGTSLLPDTLAGIHFWRHSILFIVRRTVVLLLIRRTRFQTNGAALGIPFAALVVSPCRCHCRWTWRAADMAGFCSSSNSRSRSYSYRSNNSSLSL